MIHPPTERLLPPTGIEPSQLRNSASMVTGLQLHTSTSGKNLGTFPTIFLTRV